MPPAVSAMRRVLLDGQTARPLQEKAIRKSWPQASQRARAKPWARMPYPAIMGLSPIDYHHFSRAQCSE